MLKRLLIFILLAACACFASNPPYQFIFRVANNGTVVYTRVSIATLNFVNGGCVANSSTGMVDCTLSGSGTVQTGTANDVYGNVGSTTTTGPLDTGVFTYNPSTHTLNVGSGGVNSVGPGVFGSGNTGSVATGVHRWGGLSDSGVANAYALSVTPNSGGSAYAYTAGDQFCFSPANSSTTTTPTLNVNSLGTKTIVKNGGSALVSGDLVAGHNACVLYNGTTFDLLNPATISGGALTAATYFVSQGGTTNNATNATANVLTCGGWMVPQGGLSVGHVVLAVSALDATRNSDVCFYDASGNQLADVGATTFPATGFGIIKSFGATKSFPAGKAYMCFTSATSTTLQLFMSQNAPSFYAVQSTGIATTGGACPASITPPADSFNVAGPAPAFILEP